MNDAVKEAVARSWVDEFTAREKEKDADFTRFLIDTAFFFVDAMRLKGVPDEEILRLGTKEGKNAS